MCAAVIVAGAAETASSFQLVDTGITGIYKFNGAALTGDGRVVFAPYNADGVGVFDPTNDIFTLLDISAKISMGAKFVGAALAGDGRVVFAPENADGVGVFDPRDDSFTLLDISAKISSDIKFLFAAPAGDCRVVFGPFNADGVGVFDPTDNSFSLVNIFNTISGTGKFKGAALTGDGRVVFAPYNANSVGSYAPSCTASTYPKLTSPDNAAAGTCAGLTELASGATYVPECNSGYMLSGQVTTSCSAGTLTLATCVALCTCCESRMMKLGLNLGRVCLPP